ncbi:MAG: efflux RND transporter periplasmic adaptor subunit [Bacteroidetes bacterium]|nr:efflux RND transporter periplasmic adaptor subunit [Bacteroidota bacterium]MBU1114161.1 efflux RND transporter periplasmic adaptor subunit [Bacteroidota bacterium]MBU1800117.1 efflux RND transporter periplasmic adaptor subunit [Bacteroidota bacterium]
MKNKIVTYLLLVFLGAIIGVGGFYIFNNNDTNINNHREEEETLYTCGMHPNIIESEPGTCPICGMNLTPIKNSNNNKPVDDKDRKIIYWRAPMNPNEVYDSPGKSQMGMDLVPVYEDEGSASGVVTVDGSTLQSMNVKMEFVKNKSLSPIIYTNGNLQIDERKEFALSTKFDGWIQKLYINFTGQKVTKGQKLVDIYSPKLVAAQQELITAVNYESALSGVSKGEMISNIKRKLELFDISNEDIDKIISTKKINKHMTLYAPFNGTVLSKNVIEGEMIKAGAEIIKMADLSTLWLKADVYESDINKIGIGDKAEVTFSCNPNKIYSGNISFIYPTVNQTTRAVTVRIDLKNINDELKPAMFGNVIIYGNKLRETLVIPETAVIRSGKKNTVILSLGEGKFKPVEVKLGLYSDGFYQILTGLKQNDVIVSSGQFMIDSESSLRAAVKLFSSDKPKIEEKEMNTSTMENSEMDKKPIKDVKKEETHDNEPSIVHSGIIDVESIDKNKDGKVFQDPMDWNVISDKDGKCPLCGMFLKEVSIDDAKMNLKMNGFEYK